MKDHLPWVASTIILLLGVLWLVDRSIIENGPVRVGVLEHKVSQLEKEIEILKQ